MTSDQQIAANRLNAKKSTGPRTDDGKQRSRRNAIRHGLSAETIVDVIEKRADYEVFEAKIKADYQSPNNGGARTRRPSCLAALASETHNSN